MASLKTSALSGSDSDSIPSYHLPLPAAFPTLIPQAWLPLSCLSYLWPSQAPAPCLPFSGWPVVTKSIPLASSLFSLCLPIQPPPDPPPDLSPPLSAISPTLLQG